MKRKPNMELESRNKIRDYTPDSKLNMLLIIMTHYMTIVKHKNDYIKKKKKVEIQKSKLIQKKL